MKIFIVLLLLILAVRLGLFYTHKTRLEDGQALAFTTTLLTDPIQEGKYQRLSVVLESGDRIIVRVPIFPAYHYGQTVHISGTLKSKLLTNEQIVLSMFLPKVQIEKNAQNPLLALMYVIRQSIAARYANVLSSIHASLLMGIVFGIKEDMPEDFMTELQTAGVLHVIAASGMNVTLLAGAISGVVGQVIKRRFSLLITLCILVAYAVLSGLSPSILRASCMAALVCSAQLIGRQYLAWYGLLLTGSCMVLVWPFLLLDVGFQLSFCATIGIMVASDILVSHTALKELLAKSFIGEDFFSTVSAQLTTLPILLTNFGAYSIVSIFVNALVLWVVPYLMIIGSIAAIVGFFMPLFEKVLLYIAMPLLWYFVTVVHASTKMPLTITVQTIPPTFVASYYCCLFALLLGIRHFYANKDCPAH